MAVNTRIEIICSVENIRFYKNGWGILVVSIDKTISGKPAVDSNNELIIKGNMPEVQSNTQYHVVADFTPDPKWGDQYTIVQIYSEIVFDKNDKGAQKRYLQALFTPKQFETLYKTLDDPYQVLEDADAAALVQCKYIGMHTAMEMINKFRTNMALGRIFTELAEYDLTNNMIERLMNKYHSPDIIIEKVRDNPYVLADEIDGVGWVKADILARKGGISEFDPRRIGAYIRKYLRDVGESGQSWITTDELLGAILDALGEDVPDQNITQSIQNMADDLWYDEDKTKIGLKYYYTMEYKVAEELIRLRDAEPDIKEDDYKDWQKKLHQMEEEQGWEFTEEQINGIYLALKENVVLITGMAGTGKSSLVNGILAVLNSYNYVQCALSGRAASRLSEITGKAGFTIHRLLGYPSFDPDAKQNFYYHDERPLPYEVFILDEISMVNTVLFYDLIRAIPSGAKLICLGDHGQLEAIGSGNIAHDMINSPEIPTIILSKIHRQAEASGIISEAFKVRHGQQIVEKDYAGKLIKGELQDLTINAYSDASNTYYNIMAAYSTAMADPDFDMMKTQVLVPIKSRGSACTYELNNAIQELINPKKKGKREITLYMSSGHPYVLREGDKIINTSNNYKLDPVVYNGNIGIIKSIDEINDEIIAEFVGIGVVTIPSNYWRGLELGYCITVHKGQGSQWPHVIFGLDYSAYSLLSRELLYTAITRAEKKCELVVQTSALRYATVVESVSKKQTHLYEILHELTHPKLVF